MYKTLALLALPFMFACTGKEDDSAGTGTNTTGTTPADVTCAAVRSRRMPKRTRTDRGHYAAPRMALPKPIRIDGVFRPWRATDRAVHVAHDQQVAVRHISHAGMRLHRDAAKAAKRLAVFRNDPDIQRLGSRCAHRHVEIDGTDREKHIIQAVKHGSGGAFPGQKNNRRA